MNVFKKGGFKDDFRRVFTHIIENTSQDKSQEEEEKKEEYEYEGDAQTYQRIPLAPKKVREQNAERVNEAYKTSSSSSASHESSEGELKSYRDLTIEITPGIRGDMIVHEERIKELATFLANAEARAKFEFLKGDLIGFCSMRISDSDRMVFKILEGDINNGVTKIQIISVLGHYPKSHTYTQKEAFELYTFDKLN